MLDGGAGNDTLMGGTGNDTYRVDAVGDVVTESANEGTDTVQASISYTLGTNLENLTLTGTAALNGTGNSSANIIIGNSGANTLSGLAGADTLTGGAGADHFSDTATNLNGDRITDLGLDDFIDVSGVRFSALRYSQATGLLELDTGGNGSFATKINLSTGLVGEFVATPSAVGQAASTAIRLMKDSDGDGVGDFHDNAIFVPNADQRDTDGDGYGNVVDADLNNDLFVDFADLSIFEDVFFSANANADLNGDGIVDFADLSMLEDLFFKAPGPSYIDPPVPGSKPAGSQAGNSGVADGFDYSALMSGGNSSAGSGVLGQAGSDDASLALAASAGPDVEPSTGFVNTSDLVASAHHWELDGVELGLIGVTSHAHHELMV